jgi:hypothetical protein
LLGLEDFLQGGFDIIANELPLGGEFEERDGGRGEGGRGGGGAHKIACSLIETSYGLVSGV